MTEEDQANQTLRLLGQHVGIIALGKKIVLIEGTNASLDKQTYGSILRDHFPGVVLVPSGGKGFIGSFSSLVDQVLSQSIWGVEFYMLGDRDALPYGSSPENLQNQASGRLRVLPRYHLENYFLDDDLLAQVFSQMELENSWLRDPAGIRQKLRELAQSMTSYATAVKVAAAFRAAVGNVSIMPRDCHGRTAEELAKLILDRSQAEAPRQLKKPFKPP